LKEPKLCAILNIATSTNAPIFSSFTWPLDKSPAVQKQIEKKKKRKLNKEGKEKEAMTLCASVA
jgi:hypothetical protein